MKVREIRRHYYIDSRNDGGYCDLEGSYGMALWPKEPAWEIRAVGPGFWEQPQRPHPPRLKPIKRSQPVGRAAIWQPRCSRLRVERTIPRLIAVFTLPVLAYLWLAERFGGKR